MNVVASFLKKKKIENKIKIKASACNADLTFPNAVCMLMREFTPLSRCGLHRFRLSFPPGRENRPHVESGEGVSFRVQYDLIQREEVIG